MQWETGEIVALSVGVAISLVLVLLLLLFCVRWRMPRLYRALQHFCFPNTYIPSTPPAPPRNTPRTPSASTTPSGPNRSQSRPRRQMHNVPPCPPPYSVLASQQRRGAILHLLDVIGRREGDTVHELALNNTSGEEERGRSGWSRRAEEVSPERMERRSMMELMDDENQELPKPPYASTTHESVQSFGRPSTAAATMRSHDVE
ncbi:hypothetical protein CALVIDRAFT_562807 [Calocera viscosa TUFC12733]|uniref:Uncharacterized protein n=1 Tax=Calocera viscosa (strain TUFC12733) TaxID=1330018 RepID=A0A167NPL6_CALVF|nr:hypothetical protein CALVIDRAFT_562807 [Calocera viscosa TUFC12733]